MIYYYFSRPYGSVTPIHYIYKIIVFYDGCKIIKIIII